MVFYSCLKSGIWVGLMFVNTQRTGHGFRAVLVFGEIISKVNASNLWPLTSGKPVHQAPGFTCEVPTVTDCVKILDMFSIPHLQNTIVCGIFNLHGGKCYSWNNTADCVYTRRCENVYILYPASIILCHRCEEQSALQSQAQHWTLLLWWWRESQIK